MMGAQAGEHLCRAPRRRPVSAARAGRPKSGRSGPSYGLTRPYLLFLGGITPLKNIGNLLRAFGQLAAAHDVDLVLAGFKRWSFEQELQPIGELGLKERVKFVGYVADEDLAALYSAAECLVLPSWYEGFGIPIVEAMACGCPVVTSSGRHAGSRSRRWGGVTG